MFLRLAANCLTALIVQCSFADAEQLIATMAPSRITIASSYSGSPIVAFGAIQTESAPRRDYDLIVTVTGPRQNVVARRKERVAGIWVNSGSRTFAEIPSFLGIFTNRPFAEIANADTLRKQRIGFKNAIFRKQGIDENDPYLTNLVLIRTEEKLFSEQTRGVTFLSPTAFRVDIQLPKSVLVGDYNVELKLFSNGAVIAQAATIFEVAKVGIEAFVVKASIDDSLAFGLATAAMALLIGWVAAVAFRTD
jgi:uncharacterized protein (TIGR02186 family)